MVYAAKLKFRAVEELTPGSKVQGLFQRYWPAYRKWFLQDGDAARPSYALSRRKLRAYMPELVQTYDRLVELAGGGDKVARFLSLYCPTPFFSGCSQAVWARDQVALVRNYDYPLHLFDGILLHSAWNGTRVIAVSDCLWGVLDGMNEHGLAVSLAFGGRKAIGEGFGVTLILRYILETCETTREAVAVLRRVPVQIAYNVTVVDRTGDYVTALIAPGREAIITRDPTSTNHQGRIEWPEQDGTWETLRRKEALSACLSDKKQTLTDLLACFFRPPVYRKSHGNGWGTLYTSSYYAETGEVECLWPTGVWLQSFKDFTEGERTVGYSA